MPCSCARSRMRCASSTSVTGPKFIVPRQNRLTDRPLRPRCTYSMATSSPETVDDVVDAGSERFDVVGIDGGKRCDAQLVAAQFAVGLDVDDAVGAQDLRDNGMIDGL